MPYLTIRTNHIIDRQNSEQLLRSASALVAERLGKPERYVMVSLEPVTAMLFAGSDTPLAYLELKSIGLQERQVPELSAALCSLMERETGIRQERVYIEFSSAARGMWGWNGATF